MKRSIEREDGNMVGVQTSNVQGRTMPTDVVSPTILQSSGWYDEKRPLKEAIEHRYPETCEGQSTMCLYCYG